MAVKRCVADIDVVTAAEIRIQNVFENGLPVYMSFSGGKDSLCMAQIVLNLIQKGQINAEQLIVQFVDEEAIFPCIEKTVMEWRKKFLLLGARFEWYCCEVKHFNCFNELTNDETFICWDHKKEDVWIRKPPTFSIRYHPFLKPGKDSYQDFLPKVNADGISIIGVRASESVQRLQYMSAMTQAKTKITKRLQLFPIYDWRNNDVWLYLLRESVDIPDIYLYLWQTGESKGHLRVSQFFSKDTAKSLVKMNEYYPTLMDCIVRREPNAYLAALYWDSEMFGRNSVKRKQMEKGRSKKDYKAELTRMFNNMDLYFDTPHKLAVAKKYRNFFISISVFASEKDFKEIYDGLIAGDPKLRTYRALYQTVYGRYIEGAKKKEAEKI